MDTNDAVNVNDAVPAVDPGQVPASPASNTQPADTESLNQQLRSVGINLSLDDIRNLKSGMNEAQREAAQTKKRLRDVEPFVESFEQNPSFRDYMYEQARAYNPNGMSSGGGVDPGVIAVLNPIAKDAREAREEVAQWKFNQQMDVLAKDYPEQLTDVAKQDLALTAAASGNYDLEYHFLKKYGKGILAGARTQGRQDAVQAIQASNQAYRSPAGSQAVAPPQELANMTEEQKKEWSDKEVDRIISDTDYAAKVAKMVG